MTNRILCLTLTVFLLGACQQFSTPPGPVPPHLIAYKPFIESVAFPDRIVAGRAFEATVSVSSALKPEALHAPPLSAWLVNPQPGAPLHAQFTDGAGGFTGAVYVRLWYPEPAGEAGDYSTVQVELPALSAGPHDIAFTSTDSRAGGGLRTDAFSPTGGSPDLDSQSQWPAGISVQTFTVSVEPAPGANVAYLPYISDIAAPDGIVAGQPFVITVHMSAAAKPECLQSLPFMLDGYTIAPDADALHGTDGGQVYIRLWFNEPLQSGHDSSTMALNIPALAAGDHEFTFTSVSDPSQGGLRIDDFDPLAGASDTGSIADFPEGAGIVSFTVSVPPA